MRVNRGWPGRAGVAAALVALAAFGALTVPALSAEAIAWRSGRDFQQTLERNIGPAGLAYSGQGLRDAVANLSRAGNIRIAMLVDRRIDPEARLDFALGDVPLEVAIARIAASARAETCRVGSAVYLGPPETARRLRTVAELRRAEIRKLPQADAKRLGAIKAMKWDDFAEPRSILKSLAAEADATIANLDVIPHDLWSAADLPLMTLADRLTLVAGAYDLTFEIAEDARTLRLLPLPERPTVRRTYSAGAGADEAARKIAGAFAEAKVAVTGPRITVDARVEDQLLIAAALAGKEVRKPSGNAPVRIDATRVESLNATDQPLGGLIKAIAVQLKHEVEFDGPAIAAAGIKLERTVSINVKGIMARELLERLTAPYGLEYEVTRGKIVVRPKKK